MNNINELKELWGQQNSSPCVSVLISSELQSFHDREKIELSIKKVISEIEKKLDDKYNEDISDDIIKKMNGLAEQIDITHLKDGLGIFVSPTIAKLVYLPFSVKEKIIIDNTFEIRDIVYDLKNLNDYWVLTLSKNRTRLLKYTGETLEEINDNNFPLKYENEYELERMTPHSKTGKEPSTINEVRITSFFRKADKMLNEYLKEKEVPVLLIGVDENRSDYKSVSKHSRLLIDGIKGNYDYSTDAELKQMVKLTIEGYELEKQEKELNQAIEMVFTRKGVSGIQEVWDIANEGAGNTLYVEKDYKCEAFLDESNNELFLTSGNSHKKMTDAVDDIIQTVLKNKGNVEFVDNGRIEKYGRIILTTRY